MFRTQKQPRAANALVKTDSMVLAPISTDRVRILPGESKVLGQRDDVADSIITQLCTDPEIQPPFSPGNCFDLPEPTFGRKEADSRVVETLRFNLLIPRSGGV